MCTNGSFLLLLRTMLKMSKICFPLLCPHVWGIDELILSFHIFIKMFCFLLKRGFDQEHNFTITCVFLK